MRATLLLLVSHAAAQLQTAPTPPPMPAGKGSIEGKVVNDITGEPVKKAQVMLQGPSFLTAVTDASGHFAFRRLPAGQFLLMANAAGFPPPRPGMAPPRRQVALAADEEKTGVSLSLVPGASISGRLLDEDDVPMANCSVALLQVDYSEGVKTLVTRNTAQSNDKGEYRLAEVSPGKYYVQARCMQTLPLPHAFIRRGSDVEVPTQAYAPLLYPGTPDLTGAARITASPGANVSGIDFRMSPAAGVTVRGQVTMGGAEALPPNVMLLLEPGDPLRRDWLRTYARFNPQSGEFLFQHVAPGSYEIVASTPGQGAPYYAKIPVDVGSTAPEPVRVNLTPGLTLTGMVSFDGDAPMPGANVIVALNPADHRFPAPRPNAPVQKDGRFTLSGVLPGRWRPLVGGAPGYVKAISLGEQEASPYLFEIPAGFAGSLKIVVGNKWAQLEGSVSGAPPGAGPVTALLWPAEEERQQAGLARTFGADPRGRFSLGVLPPGRYYTCAVDVPEPWPLVQNAALLNGLKSRCAALELTEGARTTVQVPFIPSRDLERITEDAAN